MMIPAKRLISGALSVLMLWALLASSLPAVLAAQAPEPAPTGAIGLTLRFDLPQTAENASGRNIRLRVSGSGGQTVIALPSGAAESNALSANVSVAEKNVDGAPLTTEARLGYYTVELSNLPAGGAEYALELTGTGYVPFRATVTLDGYSRHLIVGTGDGTFSLGDVNGDGAIDSQDLSVLDGSLGKAPDTAETRALDLNGDGRLDVTDLSYVSYTLGSSSEAQLLDTAAILTPRLDAAGLTLTGGSGADLFRDGTTVTLTPAADSGLELPILLDETDGVELSRLRITCPDGAGAVEAGTVLAELAGGSTLTIPFRAALPEGVHAIGLEEGQKVVTIDLGSKVAVKKVTIQVTRTTGGTDYAAVTKIEFLKDIVPENPKNDQPQILSATPGDGRVTLEWTAVNNITGYVVSYGTGGSLTQTVSSGSTRAVVSGLDNLKTYQFRVTAVNGSWSGTPSNVVSAMPESGSAPGAPSNISVTAADQSLRLSWGSTKDATYYQVFYRQAGQSAFTQYGGNLSGTSAAITGLTNGVTYQVAVKAGNRAGVGPYSATASGVPQREDLTLPDLPGEDRIDNSLIQSVVMANPSNVNRELCPAFVPGQVVDGSAATYWVARNWSLNSQFTYTFREPQDMNYVILVPYLGGNHKYALRSYTVSARDSEGNTLLAQTLYTAPSMNAEKNYLVLPFAPVKGAKELTVSLNEWEGNGCRVSISEMAFYRSDSLPEDIAALFADGSFTALRSGVTAEEISALTARLDAKADFYLDLARLRDELALAQSLLDGAQDALGLVKADFQSRSGGAPADQAAGQTASDLQPLGITARAGATVAVYAQLPGDAPVSVVPTQFFGESGIWRGTPIQLVNGRNYITVPQIGSLDDERGGVLYLTYAGARPEDIRIQVRGDGDTFTMPVLELSGWYSMTESARKETIRTYVAQLEAYVATLSASADLKVDVRNATELSTPSVLLSLPADRALAGLKGVGRDAQAMTDALYDSILAWEDVLFAANQVQGIIPSDQNRSDYRYPMTTRQNIRYMRMFAGAFMYAAGNHIGVGYGSTSGLVGGRPVSATGAGNANALFGWGIAHEIGHNMDKLGKAEITNNIYALAVQAWDGSSMALPTRLTAGGVWQRIYDKTSTARPGSAGDVFVQLGMYWQLHLAYDQGDKPLDFYNQFFRAWKAGKYREYAYDERVALIASETAGKNLTDFFTHWGMALSQEVRDLLSKLEDEPRAVWYLNDESYAARLAGDDGFDGAVTLSVQMKDNQALLTMEGGDEAILGYEIRRNGVSVGFTTKNTYTDDLGPANNLTYTYSVVPVDKLGGVGDEAKAPEVRVAWDTAIDPSLYTVAREGSTVILTMKNGAVPVTGVKVAGTDLTGNYTVEVKADSAAQSWTTAKQGALSGNETVGYFTKPGAGSGDARIWTYDAAVLRVTGVPEGAAVTPLGYPGDRVDLYPEAAVGRLKADYRYGEGEDDVIPAGTLVILGTYRGDPAYNTVELQVRYSTTAEAAEAAEDDLVERPMNGYALLFAEVPESGKVSDTSDGFWVFVPDWEAEAALNLEDGVPEDNSTPTQIRVVLYRNDDPTNADSRRTTSTTLWISFPEEDTLPQLVLTGAGVQ